ncbi:hypothetical protein [Asticcacaulis machinosus]|uniref:Uncharacterized protein n=1 Tax=Asticcacaulis machinosus TaxID=2984211 RepID=A0ABT5HKY4_9CAUL|nr:hypothetical protein [Asticcacaulis machinosus]MDC7676906.1 hypothetical protein [Asticcacaulis machinosus]
MPITIGSMQSKIKSKEGFDIVFKNSDGRDRNDSAHLRRRYGFLLKAKGSFTVSEWKEKRFKYRFPEYECDVLDGNGNICANQMKLINLRKTYV